MHPLQSADGFKTARREVERRPNFTVCIMTERQVQCLTWVQEGKSATDIGTILGISRRTVEWHLTGACLLLGVRTRLQAVIKARDLGVIGVAPAS